MAEFAKVATFLRDELSGIRTGRANPELLADLPVDAYGTEQPLKSLAQLSVPEATTILVAPWDKGLLAAIEQAIRAAGLDGQPTNDGTHIRFTLPPLTEERRRELVKVVGEKLEAARVSLRNIRRDEIDAAEKADLSEDELERRKKEIDDEATKVQKELDDIAEAKKQELLTV
ncbi:MAG TPA: ribosome recycling factor [Patescibacteria group bacterium]|jgi:ribosome recycling factor